MTALRKHRAGRASHPARRMLRLAAGFTILVLTGAGINGGVASVAGASSTITLRGGVSCGYHAVTGVWIQSSRGGSGFAGWEKASPGGWSAAFSKSVAVTSLPTTIQLHVGCGGTSSSWWSDNWTTGSSTSGSRTLNAVCNEGTTRPPAGANTRCAWQPTGSVILNAAKGQNGRTYCWAGGTKTGPSHGSGNYAGEAPKCGASTTIGFDCTGLTLYSVFHATRIALPHDGTQAAYAVSHGATRITSTSALKPGDIVYFGGTWNSFQHAGVYAGTDSSGRQQVWDANTAYGPYGDGVHLRLMAYEYPFVGAARF